MAWLDSIKIVSVTPQPRCTYFQELWHFRDSDCHFVGTVGVFQFQSSHISRHPVDPDNLKTGFAWLELNWSLLCGTLQPGRVFLCPSLSPSMPEFSVG